MANEQKATPEQLNNIYRTAASITEVQEGLEPAFRDLEPSHQLYLENQVAMGEAVGASQVAVRIEDLNRLLEGYAHLAQRLRQADAQQTVEEEAKVHVQRALQAAKSALWPFANYAQNWAARPMLGQDDVIHAIHGGSENGGAEIRRSECAVALEVLQALES